MYENETDKDAVEEIFGIINNAIFEFLNSKKSRNYINENLGKKLNTQFTRILLDQNYDRKILKEALREEELRANIFLRKDVKSENFPIERKSANMTKESEDPNDFNTEIENVEIKSKTSGKEDKTKKTPYWIYIIIGVVLLVLIALGIFAYTKFGNNGPLEETSVVKQEKNDGISSVEKNGEKTVVEVDAEEEPGTDNSTQKDKQPDENPAKLTSEEGKPKENDVKNDISKDSIKPVMLADQNYSIELEKQKKLDLSTKESGETIKEHPNTKLRILSVKKQNRETLKVKKSHRIFQTKSGMRLQKKMKKLL